MKKLKKNSPLTFILLTLTIITSWLCFYSYVSQKQHFQELVNENNIVKLRRFLPVLSQRTQVEHLVKKIVQNQIKSWGRIEPNVAEKVKKEFLSAFDEKLQMVLLNPEMKLVYSNGLNEQDSKFHSQMLDLFFNFTTGNSSKASLLEKKLRYSIKEKFHSTVSIYEFPNFQNIVSGKYMGQTGLIFFGIIPAKNFPKDIRQSIPASLPPEQIKSGNLGAYFIFIPDQIFLNPKWYGKGFKLVADASKSRELLGDQQEIVDHLTRSGNAKLAQKFIQISGTAPSGFFLNDLSGYCFSEIRSASNNSERQFVLHQIKLDQLPTHKSERIFIILITIGFICSTFLLIKLNSLQPRWNRGIESKFLLLSLLSCIFPLAGIFFQESTRMGLNDFIEETRIFTQQEKEFAKIENSAQTKLANLFSQLEAFTDVYPAQVDKDTPALYRSMKIIRQHSVVFLGITEPGGMFKLYETKYPQLDQTSNSLKIILSALSLFLIENLNLKTFLKPNYNKDLKSNLLLESLTDAFSMEKLYKGSTTQKSLIPYKLGQESVWIYTDFELQKEDKNRRIYLFIINRILPVRNLINQFQNMDSQNNPRMVFFRPILVNSRIAPTWAESKPEIQEYLAIAYREGEVLKQVISFPDKKVYLYGRRLKDLDWASVAIHVEKNRQQSLASNFLIFSILYIILILLILIIYFHRFFTMPIKQIRTALTEITSGNFATKLPTEGNDELGMLCNSFNKMSRELEEKEYLNRFLSNIARDAISGNKTTKATRIKATVLFSDIRSFTTITEQHPAEDIVDMLNEYMTEMEIIIEQHSGSIEKFIGDAIMVVFLPELGMACPEKRAIQASFAMLNVLEKLNDKRILQGKFAVKNGIGIASGHLLMGTLGNVKGRKDYTITGATVNRAAEMEKHSKNTSKLPIVICPETHNQITDTDLEFKKIVLSEKLTGYEIA